MDKRIAKIFDFLKQNRSYNDRVHSLEYACALKPYVKTEDKVISLLFQILNTQSQPKLDKVKLFAELIEVNKKQLKTFKGLLISLGAKKDSTPSYELLFKLLKKQPAWGDKTAALFVKALYRIHYCKQKDLTFYNDVPKLEKGDNLFVPVDRVILNIFKKLYVNIPISFKGINKYLSQSYNAKDMEVWDDLWYWGFITQKGGNEDRVFEFNDAKYWVILHNDKREIVIKDVKKKAEIFIKLIN